MADNLSSFIDHAREKGMDHATIFLILRSAGWKEKEIAEAFATRELSMPIPERAGVGSARDTFFHLLAFTALYTAAISLNFLLFTYIELALPDPVMRESTWAMESALSSIRQSLATLIVSYPLFLLVWWYLLREIRTSPEIAKSGVRRWLTSLSLFVGAVTIMTDVICVVFHMVEGDLTLRFLLKVVALFVVTGALFIYLAITLRSESKAMQ
jgi:Domain of unknown function (DUF5671)